MEDKIIEVYDLKAVNELAKKGYSLQTVFTKKEYSYNHEYNYMTLHDAYTAYIMAKD